MLVALENVIMKSNDVQQDSIMAKRNGLLKKYGIDEIKQLKGDDNRFFVRVPDSSYASGYKTIKDKTKEGIFAKLEEYDKMKNGDGRGPTFKEWFLIWKERQSVGKKRDPKTIEKYRTEYERVFSKTEIEFWHMSEIDSDELERFILKRYQEKNIPRKACKNINCLVRGMFEYALIKRVVNNDITKHVDWEMIVAQCEDSKKDESWKIVSETDESRFETAVKEKIGREPDSLVPYCALFISMTGVRAGEGVAITLDAINDKFILIDKSEKTILNKGHKTTYYIGTTKNKKIRTIPMTDELYILIQQVMSIRERNKMDSNYLFCRKDGNTEWVSTPQVRDWLRRNDCKCMQAMRATLSAQLKKRGVSPYVVSSLLGHSVRVNTTNYSPNIISLDEKRAAMCIKSLKTV